MNSYEDKLKKIKKQIETSTVAKAYFLEKASFEWIEALDEDGWFNIAPSSFEKNGKTYFTKWIEGEYLLKVCEKTPDKVLKIIQNLDTKSIDNPTVKDIIIKILLKLLDSNVITPEIDSIIHRITKEKWLRSKYLHMIPYSIEDLIDSLIKANRSDSLIILLTSVLTLKLPNDHIEKKKRSFVEPVAYVDAYIYSQILEKLSKYSIDSSEIIKKLITLLINTLKDYIDLENGIKGREKGSTTDYSTIWRKSINETERYLMHEIKNGLVSCLRDLLDNNVGNIDSTLLEELFNEQIKKYSIFRRLKTNFLSKNVNKYKTLVEKNLIDNIGDNEVLREYRDLLKNSFQHIDKKTRSVLLEKLKNIDDRNRLEKRIQKSRKFWGNAELSKEELDGAVEEYILNRQAERLEVIKEFLTQDESTDFAAILKIDSGYEEKLNREHEGFRSGPNSPITLEELSKKTIEEVIQYFKEFKYDPHDYKMISPRGLGREWERDVENRYSEYIKYIDLFRVDELLPVYIEHLITGLNKSISKMSKEETEEVLSYINRITQIIKSKEIKDLGNSEYKDNFEEGSWDWLLLDIYRYLEDFIKSDHKLNKKTLVVLEELLKYGCDYPDPGLEEENKFEHDEKDYYTHSINCIRGLAYHCIFQLTFKINRNTKWEDVVIPDFVKEILKKTIKQYSDIKTIRSVIGINLPIMAYYNFDLFKELSSYLFPLDNDDLFYIGWETYLANSIYEKPFKYLKGIYEKAIDDLVNNKVPQRRYWADPKEKLVEHIEVGYLYELEELDKNKKGLFDKFWKSKGINKYKAYLISAIGRSYAQAENPKKEKITKKIKDMMLTLWRKNLKSGNLSQEEAIEFGWWVNFSFFDNKEEILDLLNQTLKFSKGVIDYDFKILESLIQTSKEYPLLTIQCLEKMVKAEDRDRMLYFRDKSIIEVLNNIDSSTNEESKKIADDIRNYLIGKGFTEYKKF